MELGDVGLAQELQAQADAAGEVDKVGKVMDDLQQKLGIAKLQSDAFGKSFDFVGAQSTALQEAINQMLELGLKPTSEEVAKLIAMMNGLGTGTEEMNAGCLLWLRTWAAPSAPCSLTWPMPRQTWHRPWLMVR